MRFGVSTHLFHDQRLDRDHLVEIAAHGFEAIELFATRSHFDYHDAGGDRDAAPMARRHAADAAHVHAPIADGFGNGTVGAQRSRTRRRRRARAGGRREAERRWRSRGGSRATCWSCTSACRAAQATPGDNSRTPRGAASRRSAALAEPLGVRVALEVIPNALSTRRRSCDCIEERSRGAPTSASAWTSATRT